MTVQLRDYQLVARDFIRGRKKAALFLDMGLGKTAICLAALEPESLPALVVAPKKVAEEVWDVEVAKFRPDLSVAVAVGDPAARQAALRAGADITVIGRDNLRDVLSQRSRPWRTFIVDELSGYKERSSVRWKTARRIVADPTVEYVWGLTGTPSPNGLMDLWAQMYLLDGGERLGKNITTFRQRYFYPGRQLPSGVVIEWIPREEADANIKQLIGDIALSMETEGRVELPPVTHNVVPITLPPRAKKAYQDMKEELVADLTDIFGGELHSAANAAILTSKLSQISTGFLYVDEADIRGNQYVELHDEKTKAVKEIVEANGGWPVLIFYRYDVEKQRLLKAFPEARVATETGVVKDWNAGKVPVLIAHPQSAGHGLNLQYGGHTIVWVTLPWSLEEWQQANKRLARSGQEHPVVIHRIMGRNTVDHTIYRSLHDKDLVQGSILEYLESPL